MLLFAFWYCVDDHLAALFNTPALGHIPFWIMFLLSLAFASSSASRSSAES